MKLVFCIFQYFPHGGLQRDCLRIVQEAVGRGHCVDIYTTQWDGARPLGARVILLASKGWANHKRMMHFSQQLCSILPSKMYDAIIGFNKLEGLDFYFAGDVCLHARLRKGKPFFYRWLPRYRCYLRLERSVFAPTSRTQIFTLTNKQKEEYVQSYHTPGHRFHLLPPGLARNMLSFTERQRIRFQTREAFGVPSDQLLLLFVASKFHNKGLDRALYALQHIQPAHACLCVIGEDHHRKKYQTLACRLHVAPYVHFLGAKDDIVPELLAADILIHPARVEAAGMVLIEALVIGLPILTTDVCGYAFHVQAAQAGVVVKSPQISDALHDMLDINKRKLWRDNALEYAAQSDLYHLAERAMAIIEEQISCA